MLTIPILEESQQLKVDYSNLTAIACVASPLQYEVNSM
jgi:hypothetical protein